MQDQLISLYQKYCNYQITDGIQSLDFIFDYQKIHHEISNFLIKNNFGFSNVSLRLPFSSVENQDYLKKEEDVRLTGISKGHQSYESVAANPQSGSDYLHWHQDLNNSYTKQLVNEIEKFSGFKIGRVRLAWLLPNDGYRMHIDLEPLRFHIPIVTNKHCYFIQNNSMYHMNFGNIYHILTSSEHRADNFGQLPRLHLIFSTYYQGQLATDIKNIFTKEYFDDICFDHLSDIDENSLKTILKLSITNLSDSDNYIFKELCKKLLK